MGRDLTPKEMFFLTQSHVPEWNFLNITWKSPEGKTMSFFSEHEKRLIQEFPYLGKASTEVILSTFKNHKNEEITTKKVLTEVDEAIKSLVSNKEDTVDSIVRSWFCGTLDKNFYYNEMNDALFVNYLDEKIQQLQLSNSVKYWYCSTYPQDSLAKEIPEFLTFDTVYETLVEHGDFYALLGNAADSMIREKIFEEVGHRKGIDYDDIFSMWLEADFDLELNESAYVEIMKMNEQQLKAVNIQWDIDLQPGERYEEAIRDAGFPNEVLIPCDIESEEDISDYITYKTGFCHKGFDVTYAKDCHDLENR